MPGTELLVVLFGLASAFAWGAGDFSGGLASKRTTAYTVVVLSQLVSLVILALGVYLINREPYSSPAALLGAVAGVCGAVGLVALYTGLAKGPMGIVAPLTAVIAAMVPVIFSAFQSGMPAAPDAVGIILALGAVWIISRGNDQGNLVLSNLVNPLIAGLGFGVFFILIARASEHSTVWPLVFARSSSVIFILLVGLLFHKIERPARIQLPLIVIAGIFDTGGNLFYILATHYGRLEIAAVLSSLYPAATVFLAWILLQERLNQRQWIGVFLGILAVILIAI
ncbi:MAG: DMT family transporter [Anaerolineales bacterium]